MSEIETKIFKTQSKHTNYNYKKEKQVMFILPHEKPFKIRLKNQESRMLAPKYENATTSTYNNKYQRNKWYSSSSCFGMNKHKTEKNENFTATHMTNDTISTVSYDIKTITKQMNSSVLFTGQPAKQSWIYSYTSNCKYVCTKIKKHRSKQRS